MQRSIHPHTRNPVLALPSAHKLQELPPAARKALEAVLRDLAKDARGRSQTAWKRHKAPMATYWKAVAVYARHCSIALAKGGAT